MPRYARLYYPTGIFHLISRIVGNEFLIAGPAERLYYLRLLAAAAAKTDTRILAWCLMSSHVHLVVRAGREPLFRLMKSVHSGFGNWLNRRLKRKAPVFADRYKSILVDEEAYLFELIRYVHNNPVRAGLVADPADSEWTSHRAYLGMEGCPEWLHSGYVLAMFSNDVEKARQLFQTFVLAGRAEGRRPDLCGENLRSMARKTQTGIGDGWRLSGPIVGSEQFAAKVLADIASLDSVDTRMGELDKMPVEEAPPLDDLIGATCAVLNIEPWEFQDQPKRRLPALARRIIVWLWVQRYHRPQIEICRHLRVSTAAVSRWYSKAIAEINEIEPMCDMVVSTLAAKPIKPGSSKTGERRIRYTFSVEDER